MSPSSKIESEVSQSSAPHSREVHDSNVAKDTMSNQNIGKTVLVLILST